MNLNNRNTKEKNPILYFMYVCEEPERNGNLSTIEYNIIDNLTTYTNNEWLLKKYIQFYSPLLKQAKFIVKEFYDITIDELIEVVKREFHYTLNKYNDAILVGHIKLINFTWYYNGNLEDILCEIYQESSFNGDPLISDLTSIIGLYELIINTGCFIPNKTLNKFLFRICNVYIPIICFILNYSEDDWFNNLTDDAKMSITREANFPMSLEDISFYELISYDYELVNALSNFTGILGGDDE